MSNYVTSNLVPVPNPTAGIPAIRVGDQVFTMAASGGIDVSSTTAEAADVLSGKVFYNSGGVKTSGTLIISSGGGLDFYKCASVTSGGSTWTGYKAVLSGGSYSFASSVTSGLTFTSIQPTSGGIYTADALAVVRTLAGVIPGDHVFYDELTSTSTGWDGNGSVVSDTELGKNVFAITASSQSFRRTDGMGYLPYGQNDRTMSFWCRRTASVSSGWAGIGYGDGGTDGIRFTWGIYNNYPSFSAWGYDYFQTDYGEISDTNWHHYLLTLSGGNTIKLYMDGVLTWTWSTSGINTKMPSSRGIQVGDYMEGQYAPLARFSTLRIYNRVLTASEIAALAAELTPTA